MQQKDWFIGKPDAAVLMAAKNKNKIISRHARLEMAKRKRSKGKNKTFRKILSFFKNSLKA